MVEVQILHIAAHLGRHEGTGLVQDLLCGGQLLRLGRLWQLAGVDVGHLVHIETWMPAGKHVIGHHHWRVQSLQKSLTTEKTTKSQINEDPEEKNKRKRFKVISIR